MLQKKNQLTHKACFYLKYSGVLHYTIKCLCTGNIRTNFLTEYYYLSVLDKRFLLYMYYKYVLLL